MRSFLLPLLLLTLSGCVTPKPGSQTAEVRAEQVLSVSLAAIDSFLSFEARRRADVPAEVKAIATRIRTTAPQVFLTANNLRIAYKKNRTGQNEASLITALALVESLVAEIRVWVPATSSGGVDAHDSPVSVLIRESRASRVQTSSSMVALIPVFIDLAREIYAVVNSVRESAKQDQEWTPEQEADFAVRLNAIRTALHWR